MSELVAKFREEVVNLLQRDFGVSVDGKYLHWNELIRREPPPGLSHEQWWLLLKFQRQVGCMPLPITDKTGRPFRFLLPEPAPEQLHHIDLRFGGRIGFSDRVANRATRDQLYLSSLIEEAITSSQLEGATTTRQVAKELLRTGRKPRDLSERMILNNYRTMQRIGELRDQPLSKPLLLEIHRLVTADTLEDTSAAGRFRRADEAVAVYDRQDRLVHMPPAAADLDERVARLCDFANATGAPFIHPVVRSILLHFMLGYDHPFVDGNGRTARAVFYWSMLRNGYWLAEFISISHIVLRAPAKYGRAFLDCETDENDATYFVLYHLGVIMHALASLEEYIERKAAETRQFEMELRGTETLNHRQRDLLRNVIRHPGRVYTVKEHQRSHNVAYETARTDLLDLQDRRLLAGGRRGKQLVFYAAPDFNERLAALAEHAPDQRAT